MTDLEAIERLQERARAFARWVHVATGFATLGGGLVLWGLLVAAQLIAVGSAAVKLTALASFSLAVLVIPRLFNAALKRLLASKREVWIAEMVHHEGARREVLEVSFTLDSW